MGNQKCQIIGVGLYDTKMNHIKSTINNSSIILRITFQNLSDETLQKLSVGFILKNAKGIELASNNSITDNYDIEKIGVNGKITVKIEMQIPYFHQGNYTITPTVAYKNNGELELCDRVDNAIALEIYTEKQIHIYMSLETKYITE